MNGRMRKLFLLNMPSFKWAACRDVPYELMFPDLLYPGEWGGVRTDATVAAVRQRETAAKAICDGCPHLMECRTWALNNPSEARVGVWGGMTVKERGAPKHFAKVRSMVSS